MASGNTTSSTVNALEQVLSARKRSLPLAMDYNGKGTRAYAAVSSIRTPGNFDSFMIGPGTARIDALKQAGFKQP